MPAGRVLGFPSIVIFTSVWVCVSNASSACAGLPAALATWERGAWVSGVYCWRSVVGVGPFPLVVVWSSAGRLERGVVGGFSEVTVVEGAAVPVSRRESANAPAAS